MGIVGSPRKGGNTDILVSRVLEGAKSKAAEVEKVHLQDLNIHPCQGAFSCEARKGCVLPDDMQSLYKKLHEADGIVIGTPVYVGNASGMLVNFLDRCRPFISFLDSPEVEKPALSPVEEKALLHDNTCLQIWKGKPYEELPSTAEEVMLRSIHGYIEKHPSSHPIAARRLAKGKKGSSFSLITNLGSKSIRGLSISFSLICIIFGAWKS